MANELPDCRMRFPPTAIDFPADVGTTGQQHDDYPAPAQQPRYDWMRMALIALLSNQASYEEPTQYRDGTLWFDLSALVLRIRRANAWASLADVIEMAKDGDSVITLADMFAMIQQVASQRPQAVFAGRVDSPSADVIPIPPACRPAAGSVSRPLVWQNGGLVDPRRCEFLGGQSPNSIRLSGVSLAHGDAFTVLITNVAVEMFQVPDVVL